MTRTVIATDNFNRAGPGLGTDWTNFVAARGNVQIDSSIRGTGAFSGLGNDHPSARWTGAGSFTSDQYASVVVLNPLTLNGGNNKFGVVVRSSGADSTRSYYEACIECDSLTTPTTLLIKWVSGTRTVLFSAATTWAANDRLEIEAEGTTIRLMKNGTALGGSFTQTDSSVASGAPGVSCTAAQFVDDWEGGNFSASGGSATPRMSMMGIG